MRSERVNITKVSGGNVEVASDDVAVEEPLQIDLLFGASGSEQVKHIAITMRTPGNDDELAAGFLFTEGLIEKRDQLINIVPGASGSNNVLAISRCPYMPALEFSERNFFVSSSCGVCGKASIDALKRSASFRPGESQVSFKATNLYTLPAKLKGGQRVFHTTGGLHACAMFDEHGQLIMLREDVGRHNALDKLIGSLFLNDRLPSDSFILLLSGRASFELVQKAAMAGIQVIAAIGAPSSLAVELARESGITLIGFLKEDRFNIYSHPFRIEQTSNHETAHQR